MTTGACGSSFSIGQANDVSLYLNELRVWSFGSFLNFNEAPGNSRTFTLPQASPSKCYTIRVSKQLGFDATITVSPRFEIR
jgi:hypothetical protein